MLGVEREDVGLEVADVDGVLAVPLGATLGARAHAAVRLERPVRAAGLRVERVDRAVVAADEHAAARRSPGCRTPACRPGIRTPTSASGSARRRRSCPASADSASSTESTPKPFHCGFAARLPIAAGLVAHEAGARHAGGAERLARQILGDRAAFSRDAELHRLHRHRAARHRDEDRFGACDPSARPSTACARSAGRDSWRSCPCRPSAASTASARTTVRLKPDTTDTTQHATRRTPNAERRTPNDRTPERPRTSRHCRFAVNVPSPSPSMIELCPSSCPCRPCRCRSPLSVVALHVDGEREGDVRALDRAGEVGFAERAGVVAGELLAVLLERERRRAGAGRRSRR